MRYIPLMANSLSHIQFCPQSNVRVQECAGVECRELSQDLARFDDDYDPPRARLDVEPDAGVMFDDLAARLFDFGVALMQVAALDEGALS